MDEKIDLMYRIFNRVKNSVTLESSGTSPGNVTFTGLQISRPYLSLSHIHLAVGYAPSAADLEIYVIYGEVGDASAQPNSCQFASGSSLATFDRTELGTGHEEVNSVRLVSIDKDFILGFTHEINLHGSRFLGSIIDGNNGRVHFI